jgi:hypothetical protein
MLSLPNRQKIHIKKCSFYTSSYFRSNSTKGSKGYSPLGEGVQTKFLSEESGDESLCLPKELLGKDTFKSAFAKTAP